MPHAGPGMGPTSARMTNYWLGGTNYTAADQVLAEEIGRICPAVPQMALDSRLFTARAVTWAATEGIRQFLDLGCGLAPPGPLPSVHATARAVRPDARVGYVDSDAEVIDHLGDVTLAGPHEGIAVVRADLSDPAAVLAELEREKIIDPSAPACVIATLVLHFRAPEEARELIAAYAGLLAPGSCLAISTPRVDDGFTWDRLAKAYPAAAWDFARGEFAALFDGLELIPPGIAPARCLRPGWADAPGRRRDPGPAYVLAGIGRVTRP